MAFLYFIFLILVLFVFFVITLLFIFEVLAVFTSNVPFITTPRHVESSIIKSFQFSEKSILYDLGCGNGRILKKIVDLNSSITAIGVEVAFIPYILAKFFTRNYKKIKIKRKDIFKTNISDATHIFLYLSPVVVNTLIESIKKQCASGTVIISCDFEITSLKPVEIITVKKENFARGQKLFKYVV